MLRLRCDRCGKTLLYPDLEHNETLRWVFCSNCIEEAGNRTGYEWFRDLKEPNAHKKAVTAGGQIHL